MFSNISSCIMLTIFCVVLTFGIFVAGDVSKQDDSLDSNNSGEVLHSIFKRLDSVESKLLKQEDDNAELRQTVMDLQNQNHQLRNKVTMLQAREQARDREMEDLQKQVKVLTARDQERIAEIKRLVAHVNQLTRTDRDVLLRQDNKEPEKMSTERSPYRGIRHIQRRGSELKVAFFSALGNHLQHLGANQNIAFDRVITNIGNGYNNHAGDFRAPVAGTYVFSVTLMAYVSHTTHYNVVQNGTVVANIYVRGKESPYASSSLSAVLQLKQGEDVAIKNVDTDEYLHGDSYSVFSGFLLYQDYSSPSVIGK